MNSYIILKDAEFTDADFWITAILLVISVVVCILSNRIHR